MEVVSLSRDPSQPCVLVRLENLRVLLDTPLDLSPLYQYLPANGLQPRSVEELPSWQPPPGTGASLEDPSLLKIANGQVFVNDRGELSSPDYGLVDVSGIDAVLVSHAASYAGLPFLLSRPGFRGRVFTTDPSAQIGGFLIKQMEELLERVPDRGDAGQAWKGAGLSKLFPNPPPSDPYFWRRVYSREAVAEALGKVEIVAYKEETELFGVGTVTALCSGYAIGAANWLLRTDFEKIGLLTSSSSLTTHTRALDREGLAGVDVLVMAGLSKCPAHPPSRSIDELSKAVIETVRSGATALLPIQPSGLIYDLLEVLLHHLGRAGLDQVPFYVVDPVGKALLMYSNIYSEWLSEAKMKLAYLPEDPFPHAANLRSGRVEALEATWSEGAQIKAPSVVFASHPSLRLGCTVSLIRLLAASPANSLILTDPDFSAPALLAPFQPLAMKAFSFPVDSRLNYDQAEALLATLKPKHLILPSEVAQLNPDPTLGFQADWARFMGRARAETRLQEMSLGQPVRVELERSSSLVRVEPGLAAELRVQTLSDGTELSALRGYLDAWNNRLELRKEPPKDPKEERPETLPQSGALFGPLSPTKLRQSLQRQGFTAVELLAEGSGGDFVMSLGDGASLAVEGGQRTRLEFERYDAKAKAMAAAAVRHCLLEL